MNFWEPFTWKYHLTALSRRRSLDEMKDNKGFGLWIETTTRMFSIPRMPGIFNVGTATVVSKTNVKPWPENDETNSCPTSDWPSASQKNPRSMQGQERWPQLRTPLAVQPVKRSDQKCVQQWKRMPKLVFFSKLTNGTFSMLQARSDFFVKFGFTF